MTIQHPHRQMHVASIDHVQQRGLSLIETMISTLVMTVGILGLLRSQSMLHLNSDASRHRSEALRLAQQSLEHQRAFATLKPTPGLNDFTAITQGQASVGTDTGFKTNTRYTVQRHIDTVFDGALKASHVAVEWTDRRGEPQALHLHTWLARQSPVLSATLSQPGRGNDAWAVGGRSIHIPSQAKDLGDGRSLFKPLSSGHLGWVFDNTNGHIISTCQGLTDALERINTTHLTQCEKTSGWLLSGLLRFSLSAPPHASRANDLPLPSTIALQLSVAPSSTAPSCFTERVKVVQIKTAQGIQSVPVPLDGPPHHDNLTAWTDTAERFSTYHCLIPTPSSSTPSAWSGRSDILPQGWTIGQGAGQYRVCRFSSDTDGSGAIDRNEEHPAHYRQVQTHLLQQNFLVIRGEFDCPSAQPTKDGLGHTTPTEWNTVMHQPG